MGKGASQAEERFREGIDGAANHRGSGRPLRMADFRNLLVWQNANKLSVATAEAVESFRGNAGSILRRQLLRSTFSIQANIAEGSSKRSDREFARCVRIALGSSTSLQITSFSCGTLGSSTIQPSHRSTPSLTRLEKC